MHIGVHAGPVIFQDGDVYGTTVNLASGIASSAGAGQVLATDEIVGRFAAPEVHFRSLGPVNLKGTAQPVTRYEAVRADAGGIGRAGCRMPGLVDRRS